MNQKKSSTIRVVILIVILVVGGGALAFDFLVARPAAQRVYDQVGALSDQNANRCYVLHAVPGGRKIPTT